MNQVIRTVSAVTLLLCGTSSIATESSDALQAMCQIALSKISSDSDFKQPEYVSDPSPQSSSVPVESYPYYGKSVPLIPYYDGWFFAFAHGNPVIANEEPSVSYHMGESQEVGMVFWALQVLEENGLVLENPNPFDLIERGLAFNPGPNTCKSTDPEELRTEIVDLFVKRAVFSSFDRVYKHNKGFLGLRRHEYRDVWLYIFAGPSGEYREIRIYNGTPSEFQGIGFEIRDYERPNASVTPEWLHSFFEVANGPSNIRLEKLKQAVGEYPLPAVSFQSIEEYLQGAESESPE